MSKKSADYYRILSHLNFVRIINLFKLYFSFFLSKSFKKAIIFGKPFTISIEPTTACNLSCPECPSGLKKFSRAQGTLSPDLHHHILDEMKKTAFYVNYYFQGEPFIHPHFLQYVIEAKKKNFYTSTSTNAHFIDSKNVHELILSGLDRLIISLDGLTQKTYESYRINGQLEKVFQAIELIQSKKKELQSKTPYLIVQFLVVKTNEHEIEELRKWAKDKQVDELRLKTAQFYSYENGHPLMPSNVQFSRYKKSKDGRFELKNKMKNECWRMWSSCVFTWDAKIVPCCFDKDAEHQMGSIYKKESNFAEIWYSKKYKQFRAQILHNRESIDICKNCSEGSKVWI
ncbi:MAG: SPASM domain-containing protein [Flavobacteriia bacterium]|nr:SPASM domain-containing protein [Flavobacteriia bacterium]